VVKWGLVFAAVGSESGVLSKPLEAAVIVMVILTYLHGSTIAALLCLANPIVATATALGAQSIPAVTLNPGLVDLENVEPESE
jgi:predicted RND superfamily exporter protein